MESQIPKTFFSGTTNTALPITLMHIYSQNVVLPEQLTPIPALLTVNPATGLIKSITTQSDEDYRSSFLALKNKPNFIDFSEYVILPGIIDQNCSLNLAFQSDEWCKVEASTQLAAMGGVTTIIDGPGYRDETFIKATEMECLKFKQKRLENLPVGSLKTDVLFLANLQDYSEEELLEMKQMNVCGFKGYLMTPFQHGIAYMENPQQLAKTMENIAQVLPNYKICLHCEQPENREFELASPLRKLPIEERIKCDNLKIDLTLLKDGYAGGEIDIMSPFMKSVDNSPLLINDLLDKKSQQKNQQTEKFEENCLQVSPIDSTSSIINLKNEKNEKASLQEQKRNDKYSLRSDSPETSMINRRAKRCSKDYSLKMISLLDQTGYSNKNMDVISSILSQSSNQIQQSALNKTSFSSLIKDKLMFSQQKQELFQQSNNSELSLQGQPAQKADVQREKVGTPGLISDASQNSDTPQTPCTPLFNISLRNAGISSKSIQRPSLLSRRNFKVSQIATQKSNETNDKQIEKLRYDYYYFAANRPSQWETQAFVTIKKILREMTDKLVRQVKVNLASLTTSSLITDIRMYNQSKINRKLGTEVNAVNLFFNDKLIDKHDTKFKHGQPIKSEVNQKLLLQLLMKSGSFSIGSGHLYVPQLYKTSNNRCFYRALNGYNSIGFNLQAVWTALVLNCFNEEVQNKAMSHQSEADIINKNEGAETQSDYTVDEIMGSPVEKRRIFDISVIQDIVDLQSKSKRLVQVSDSLSRVPALNLGLANQGTLEVGKMANLLIFNPFTAQTEKVDLLDNHLFDGQRTIGRVEATLLRGIWSYKSAHISSTIENI